MALLRRELCRQLKGPEITHADFCTLVFDTDAKTLYVEREVAKAALCRRWESRLEESNGTQTFNRFHCNDSVCVVLDARFPL